MKKNLVVIEELKKQGKALLDARRLFAVILFNAVTIGTCVLVTLSDKVFCQMNF